MLHTEEAMTCPLVDDPGDFHFEMVCEDCDVDRLARKPLGKVEELYHMGRITQDEWEAYSHVWAVLSTSGSRPEWRAELESPVAARIARKLRARVEARR